MTSIGERASTSRTFLKETMGRKNLEIRLESRVDRLQIGDRRVAGIVIQGKSGSEYVVSVNEAVVLSAGTFGTPKILMLSGVGSAEELSRVGIPVVADTKSVGQGY